MKDPSQIRVSGPLGPYAFGFSQSLAQQGYTANSARLQMYLLAHLSRWLEGEGLGVHELRSEHVERFLCGRRKVGYTQYLTAKALRPIVMHLRENGILFRPTLNPADCIVDLTVERYRQYLNQERGVASSTAHGYIHAIRPFLNSRASSDGRNLDWKSLDASSITRFVIDSASQQSPGSAKLTVTALRSLLSFLQLDGVIEGSLTSGIPSVARWQRAGLPKGLSPAEIQALLASCDRHSVMGRRDFAVLTTLVRLGLRAGEVAGLRLDDIDWRNGIVVVRGKGQCVDELPLPTDVGVAIVEYLRDGRPITATERVVFVRSRAPHCRLATSGVTQIVFAAARRAGFEHMFAHRLRHTVATQMLRAGAPFSEIGQLLRHRRASTTAIYAKVDREALRSIARPWPGGVA
jgi:integrase/recombinase XerD